MSKIIKMIHTSDWHFDGEKVRAEKLSESMAQLLEFVKNNEVHAIVNAGDVWEKSQSYSDKSGVNLCLKYLRLIAKEVHFIFIVKGNNSHDEPGSINLLHQLEPNIYAYEVPVALAVGGANYVKDLLRVEDIHESNVDFIVSLVPYPTKSAFITNDSIDNNNVEFIEKFESIFDLIGNVTAEYNVPKVLAFHGNVIGSRLSSGQTLVSQDIQVAPSTLEKAKADYYALGHIHLRQWFKTNIVYSGGIINNNWGETERKSFEFIQFVPVYKDDKVFEYLLDNDRVFFENARPMIKVTGEFLPEMAEGNFLIHPQEDNSIPFDFKNSEFRFRCDVKENDRKLLTPEKIDFLKNYFGNDVKIEYNIIPDERESRSLEIMNCNSLLDEVKEYSKVIKYKINKSIETKVIEINQ